MTLSFVILASFLTFVIGGGLGYLFRWLLSIGRQDSIEYKIRKRLVEAREEVERITTEAHTKAEAILSNAQKERRKMEDELKDRTERLEKREVYIDEQHIKLQEELKSMSSAQEKLKDAENRVNIKEQKLIQELESLSSLSREKAEEKLLEALKRESAEDLRARISKIDATSREEIESRAKEMVATAIGRLGNKVPSEVLITHVNLPSDDVKGKIIGKDGKNIRAFEREAGVNLIIDESPGVLTISSFDPLRREIARRALESLLADGRIHPGRIEEEIASAKAETEAIMRQKGEEAVTRCGIYTLDPRLVEKIGRLHFRTSYGQNVLTHSIEVSILAGLLAEEIGGDVYTARVGGLLHDIGKGADTTQVGSHVAIGMQILKQHGVDEVVINAMKSHHGDYPHESLEAVLVQVADSLSGSRPGARNESTEHYIERLNDLETIANEMPGVDKSYVISGGRELRIFVHPQDVSDIEARELARKIALKIEEKIRYGGEIKVHVIRESRVVEYAR